MHVEIIQKQHEKEQKNKMEGHWEWGGLSLHRQPYHSLYLLLVGENLKDRFKLS